MDFLTNRIKPMYFKYLTALLDISTFAQCCAYSIGQAFQPIISTNFGAGKGERISEILKYAIGTAVAFACIWAGMAELAIRALHYICKPIILR